MPVAEAESRTPVAFVSYAREGEAHSNWVRRFAERLRSRGVESRLDQWHLRPADHLPQFMATSVRDSDFVLMVCTPRYAAKANANEGGVGFEGSIIAGSILTSPQSQNKFIPILRAGTPAESIPTFMWNRLYLDFSDDSAVDTATEQLARHLHGQPGDVPPPVSPYSVRRDIELGARPDKWVLVAGTGDRDRLPNKLERLCKELGQEIARARFGLVSGGWPGVDRSVTVSFAEKLETLGFPLENFLVQVVEQSWSPPFRAGQIISVPSGEAEYIESVRRSDAAILVGGLGGTYKTGEYMRIAGKAVFPMPQTGGDAIKFFNRMRAKWYSGCISNISKEDFITLEDTSLTSAGPVIRLLERWRSA